MRKKIVAGNWKMNLDYNEGLSLFSELINMINDEVTGKQEAVVCSPFIHLHNLAHLAKIISNSSSGIASFEPQIAPMLSIRFNWAFSIVLSKQIGS